MNIRDELEKIKSKWPMSNQGRKLMMTLGLSKCAIVAEENGEITYTSLMGILHEHLTEDIANEMLAILKTIE